MVKIENKKIRKELLKKTWENIYNQFPNWKKNKILKTRKSKKNLYMRTINKFTYPIYIAIFRRIK